MMIDPATTQVSTSDTSDGVAIAFTTTSDVDEVRARVHHMADMHNQITGMRTPEKDTGMQHGAMPGGREGGIGTEGATSQSEEIPSHEHMPGMQMVPASATAEDIPGGARVVLVPADPVQLTALREDARLRADMMRKGQCPMRTAS